MSLKRLLPVAIALFAVRCGAPQGPPPGAGAPDTPAAQLGGPATGAGTLSADVGEIRPADPARSTRSQATPRMREGAIRNAPYFGDEHLHTSWSVDAGGTGTTLGPEEATRFARGEEVVSTSGQPVKLASRSTGSSSPITPTAWVLSPRSRRAIRS